MACLHPLKRWVIGYDHTKDQDIARITNWETKFIVRSDGKPIYKYEQVPCGKCIECRLEYARTWAIRCILEAKKWEHNEMLTLTYDDEHLPKTQGIDPKTGELKEVETLVKKDVQDFLKRLRSAFKKQYGQDNIRYFMCGEYGDENKRPHYHLILYNIKVEDKELITHNKKGNEIWSSKKIQELWGKGLTTLTNVDYETCEYVARYVIKKQKGPGAKEQYIDRNQIPEYTCMSRRPGIASNYFEELKGENYEKKKIWIQTQKTLKQAKPPRYFDKLFEQFDPDKMKEIKQRRKELQQQREATLLAQTSLNIEEYRKVMEDNIKARLKNTRLFEGGE